MFANLYDIVQYTLPKALKIPLILLGSLLGLALLLLLVAQTAWFKNYASDKATNYLSKELGVPVSIGEVSLSYFDELKAEDVYIEDQHHDTLIYIKTLKADYDVFSFTNEEVKLNHVFIAEGNIQIGVPQDSSSLNIQFLIDYFSPPPSGKPSSSPTLVFDQVEITDTRFRYFNSNYISPTSRSFDENNMVFSQLNGHLHDFTIIKDSISFALDDIRGAEKSGLTIEDLHAQTIISSTTMEFTDLYLQTPQSTLRDYLRFSYSSYADFSDFYSKVNLKTNLTKSSIHTDDLAYFYTDLRRYNEMIKGTGTITGTVDNLASNKLHLELGTHTQFTGSAVVKGLPNINKTYFDLKAKTAKSTASDIAELANLDPAPKEFLALEQLKYTGTFKGYIQNFDVNGDLTTAVGSAKVNLHYSMPTNTETTYAGTLQSDQINLGQLLDNDKLGNTAFDVVINGKGLTLHTLSTQLSGKIKLLEYANYGYQNIAIDGEFHENLFDGMGSIADPNFDLRFNGTLDLTSDQPKIDVASNIKRVNLRLLGLDSLDNYVRFNGDIALEGNNLDDVTGSVKLDSFELTRRGSSYTVKDLEVTAARDGEQKLWNMHSDLLSAAVKGNFQSTELEHILGYITHIIHPTQFDRPAQELTSSNLTVNLEIPAYKPILKEFLGKTYFDSLRFALDYNHERGKLNANSKLHGLMYDVLTIPQITLNIKNGGELSPINFAINTSGVYQNDSTLFDVLHAHGFMSDGAIHFETTAARDKIVSLALGGRFLYTNDSALVYVDESDVRIYGDEWQFRKANTPNVIYQNGIVELRSLDFRKDEQILYLEASSGFQADKINMILTEFKLDNLTPFIAGFDMKLQGLTNGFIDISDREGFPIIEADLTIYDLQLDNDTLGNLSLVSENKNLLAVAINGEVNEGLFNDMKIVGDIDFTHKDSPLDLHLITERSSIKPFEKYLTGLASQIDGLSTTDIKITGPLRSPQLRGTMELDSLSFTVDYLQTNYTGHAAIDIDYTTFKLRQAELTDRFNKKGRLTGDVRHTNFKDLNFNLAIDQLDNFEIMNTGRKDNSLFYGTAFVDGDMKILGPIDDILLQINAKSRKGTEIAIPLDNIEASGNLSYVQFVNLKEDNNQLNENFKSEAGVRMDFNFEVTNDANVTLIFDELLGDKIKASGHGNLRMEINTYGDFNMYGGLTIDKGSYLFTALDLITKYFTVNPGGTLFWDGNPYNAKIDLEAIKREYPVPKTLMSGSTEDLEQYSQSIPVDCYLKLNGLLFDPEVSFDLKFPTQTSINGSASNALNNTLERIRLDQEELNRQVFALMVLGTFVPPSFANGAALNAEDVVGNTGINSLSDFASSQLNNWLSQIDTRLQLGIDYQTSTQSEQAELILSLRRKFYNDRLEFSASVDAASDGNKPYDLNLSYDITKDGSVRLNGFQKQTTDPTLGNLNNIQTAGVGLSFRYQFDKFRTRKKKLKPEKKITGNL